MVSGRRPVSSALLYTVSSAGSPLIAGTGTVPENAACSVLP